jgi:hypothetical protein
VTPDESWKPVDPSAPAWRILGLLAATIGLPYFLLSTTGPLIQAWYVQKRPGAACLTGCLRCRTSARCWRC